MMVCVKCRVKRLCRFERFEDFRAFLAWCYRNHFSSRFMNGVLRDAWDDYYWQKELDEQLQQDYEGPRFLQHSPINEELGQTLNWREILDHDDSSGETLPF